MQHGNVLFDLKLPNGEGVMRGRIIVQQAPGLGCVRIRSHARDPFQQLVKHMFVEVRIHRLPRRNELSMDHAAWIKKHDQHRLHMWFLPLQFLWSRRPLARPFRTLSFSSRVVRKTPRFVPLTIVVKNAGSRRCAARRSSHEATQSAFCSTVNACSTKRVQIFFYPGLWWWCDVLFLD